MFVSGPTDGTRRKDYCRFSQRYERPGCSERLMDGFGITPADGAPDTPVQTPHTASQLLDYSLTPPRMALPPIKRGEHVIPDVGTTTGSIKRWVVSKSLGKSESRGARKRRWGDLWALGAKSRARQSIKIGDGNKRLMSKSIAIKGPHGDGVRAIVS
ncbi:hypothetical protein HOY80DRAFT_1140904 [Tuber brumale]|nr:hypothetical protein HOY80DRAFT_1140904 [Tuber brumale]